MRLSTHHCGVQARTYLESEVAASRHFDLVEEAGQKVHFAVALRLQPPHHIS